MNPHSPQHPDPRDSKAGQDRNTDETPRHPGAPEPILERGFGDEHGGYSIQPEEERPPTAVPGADPVPGARP